MGTLNTSDFEIIYANGYYRFVNHKKYLMTTGFKKHNILITYKDMFLDNVMARKIMIMRYFNYYNRFK